MDERTLTALKGSIEKWEGIVAGAMADEGASNCPLCAMFNDDSEGMCEGCPVYEFTESIWCARTPFVEWAHKVPVGQKAKTPEEVALAQAELDFLRSLLPENATKRSA